MKKILVGIWCLIVAVGCSSESDPLQPPAPGEVVARPNTYSKVRSLRGDGTGTPSDMYRGRTAEEWSARAHDPDRQVRLQALQALGRLQEKGYPHLKEAMQSQSADVRLHAMQAIPLPVLVKHENESVPMLIRLLGDPNAAVRTQAAVRLAWFDSTDGERIRPGHQAAARMQSLQALAQADPDPRVRMAAGQSYLSIQEAMTGVVAGDE